jgi:putative salt-induced outer membrane protein YdiY
MNKKNNIITALALLLFSCHPAFAKSDTALKIGGTFINSNESVITASIDNALEKDEWQSIFELDYVNKKSDSINKLKKFNSSVKINYTFAPKHYIFGVAVYDYDKFRDNTDRKVTGAGYGYKLLRTDKIKASNEISIASLQTNTFNEPVFRNSTWLFFDVADNIQFVNKFLYEVGDKSGNYVRNETGLNFMVTDDIVIGLQNVYTKDPIKNNVLNFTLGVKL